MGFSVVKLPHYVIWHIYEPSSDDLKHMEWMASEEVRQQEEAKIKKFTIKYGIKLLKMFKIIGIKKEVNFENTDMSNVRKIKVDWSGVEF